MCHCLIHQDLSHLSSFDHEYLLLNKQKIIFCIIKFCEKLLENWTIPYIRTPILSSFHGQHRSTYSMMGGIQMFHLFGRARLSHQISKLSSSFDFEPTFLSDNFLVFQLWKEVYFRWLLFPQYEVHNVVLKEIFNYVNLVLSVNRSEIIIKCSFHKLPVAMVFGEKNCMWNMIYTFKLKFIFGSNCHVI